MLSGVSDRPTEDLDAFSASCDDVSVDVERLVAEPDRAGYSTEIYRNTESFAQMTVRSGQWRRTELRAELGRDAQLLDAVTSPIGPMLSIRELAANKVLAASGRHEPRDLVDLAQVAIVVSLDDAFADAVLKDPGFDGDILREMVTRTCSISDDLWPTGSNPQRVRDFVTAEILPADLPACLHRQRNRDSTPTSCRRPSAWRQATDRRVTSEGVPRLPVVSGSE